MTYEQWIKQQIKRGWQPPVLSQATIDAKAAKAFQDYLDRR